MTETQIEQLPLSGQTRGRKATLQKVSSPIQLLIIALPSVYAAVVGVNEWYSRRTTPLAPDAQAYLALAGTFGPSSVVGGLREPLWPALMTPLTALLGVTPDVPRMLGVAGFVFMIASFQLVVSRLHGRFRALVSAALLASSPWLIFQAGRGLREEAAAGMLLLFGLGVTRMGVRDPHILWIALLAGVSAMLRWDTLLVTLPVLAVAFVVGRVEARRWVSAIAVIAVVVSPLVIGNWVVRGDPMYHSNVHAKYFRNQEFGGKPGFPTLSEVAADSFTGPSITWAGYLFGLHDTAQLAQRTVSGAVLVPYAEVYKALFYDNDSSGSEEVTGLLRYMRPGVVVLAVVLGAAGAILMLLGQAWPLGIITFLSMIEFAPINGLFDLRLAITTLPVLLLGSLELFAILVQSQRREPAIRRLRSLMRVATVAPAAMFRPSSPGKGI